MGKPIIRHCRNCKYCTSNVSVGNVYCDVKYKVYSHKVQRIVAMFCRFYKTEEGAE